MMMLYKLRKDAMPKRVLRDGLFLIAAIIALYMVASCNYQNFCDYEHPHTGLNFREVEVIFNWDKAPEANPASVAVYFFLADDDPLQTRSGNFNYHYEFTEKKDGKIRGGKIVLPVATYNIICVNSDNYDGAFILNNATDFHTFEITTREETVLHAQGLIVQNLPKAKGVEEEATVGAPTMQIYTASRTNVEVKDVPEVEATKVIDPIVLTPAPLLKRYTVVLENNSHMSNVVSFHGTLSSLVGGYMAGGAFQTPEKTTVMFSQHPEVKANNTVTGSFWTFGHCPISSNDVSHIYTVYATLKDGSKRYHSWDVTKQVHNAPDQTNITVVIEDGLDWPVSTAGGMQIYVEAWSDVIIIKPDMGG